MKLNFRFRSQLGVTIIEMLIVVAVIGILAAIAVPSLTGFLSTSKEESIRSDKGSLQSAVDGYRSANSNTIPIKVEVGDTVTTASNSITNCLTNASGSLRTSPPKNNCFLDLEALATGGFLSSASSVTSASSDNAAGNTGLYSWVLMTNGEVTAFEKATGLRVLILGGYE